jgi:hypothetical protein
MILKEIKEWMNSLPEDVLEYTVVIGEEGKIDDQYWYRVDKPIVTLLVDNENKEVVILSPKEGEFTEEEKADFSD